MLTNNTTVRNMQIEKPVVAVTTGETVTIDCNLGTVTNSDARWYKQIPGGVPQFVLSYHHSDSSPTYGTGFSSPKFTSTHQSTSDYRLTIKNIEEGDSAVYYCNTWDGEREGRTPTQSSFRKQKRTLIPKTWSENCDEIMGMTCASAHQHLVMTPQVTTDTHGLNTQGRCR
uniref:Ig-like domain-containing protein n=1 Tax=Gasterosteus aculeatus aculeatus TaxID=481459 RepID=A0AAQ4R7N6_GASAC